MIIVKEIDGVINVADIDRANSDGSPGALLQPWTPIGPGLAPVVTWDVDGTYYIAFDYMGHIYVREMDASIWPPQIIDPVTYTPNISLQNPQDALTLGFRSSTGWAPDPFEVELLGIGAMRQTGGMVESLTTGILSTTVARDTSITPVTASKWRVYQREVGASAWTLIKDWTIDIGTLTVSGVNPLRMEFSCTYGYMWTPAGRNLDSNISGDYRESAMGPILTIDSTTQPLTLQDHASDISTVQFGGNTHPGSAWFDSPIMFFTEAGADIIHAGAGPHNDLGLASMLQPRSSPFLISPIPSDVFHAHLGVVQTTGAMTLFST